MAEEFRGEATLDRPDGSGSVHYAVPNTDTLDLPAGTLFPTEHIRRLIQAARERRSVVANEVFDGSGPDALTRVTAVIGDARQQAATGDQPAGVRWPVSLAYYDLKDANSTPQFELSFDLADNGVLYNVMLNYGDFALKADLEKVDTFAAPVCK